MLIGGFYSVDGNLLLDPGEGREFQLRLDQKGDYPVRVYTNNGRTASVQALKHCRERMKGKKVLLPDYLCLSVISAMEAAGVEYGFYKVGRNLEIDMQDLERNLDEEVGMIYVIQYFSVPQPKKIVKRLKEIAAERGLLLMEDITQALFSRDSERMGFGDYVTASLRKWFPMTDGGLLAVKSGMTGHMPLLADAYDESVYQELLISVLRMQYILQPDREKESYLKHEKKANASRYQDLTPRAMTEASSRILGHADIEQLMRQRIENFRYLYDRLSRIKGIEILSRDIGEGNDFVPFGLTILTEERDKLYQHLADHGIIPEIQWILPVEYYAPGDDAAYLSEHNLMLQCDQRYSQKEMEYVAETIADFFQ